MFIESYGYLYYCYLRPDLCLNIQQLEKLTYQNVRTLQRRQNVGIQHLMMALLDAELALPASKPHVTV